MYAPVVLFTYNRPLHTKKTLDTLALNPEAKDTELYIYCDGPKVNASKEDLGLIKEVYNLVNKENRFKSVKVTTQKNNKGLADSIVDGVTLIVDKYKKVIVLEDDIVTSKAFLKYMNDALLLYEESSEVMHISGYMYPNKQELPETFFYNVTLCWGWATWDRAWKHFNPDALKLRQDLKKNNLLTELNKFGGQYLSNQLADNITGKLNTWFIKWHASVLLKGGYTLFPKKSLVDNIGFDNSGVHNGMHDDFKIKSLAKEILVHPIEIKENQQAKNIIKGFYNRLLVSTRNKSFKNKVKDQVKRLLFWFSPSLKNKLKGKNENISTRTYLGKHCKVYPKYRLSDTLIGSYTYVSENAVINNTVIGKFCSIGANFMAGRGVHPTDGISTHPMFYSKSKQNGISLVEENKINEFAPIIIGNDVFIGMNVTVLDGITIGDGAIIGAGATVSKDIPPYAIAVGNPIKIIKYRFNEEKIRKLLELKWWNMEHEDLCLVEKHFFNLEGFFDEIKVNK